MAKRWQKAVWALMCGGALGLWACDDTGNPPHDAAIDEHVDAVDDAVDAAVDVEPELEEDPGMTYYGPAPDY